MTKRSAVDRMIFGLDPYASKSLIRHYGGYSLKVADELFLRCKAIEESHNDIDLRPGYVLKSTFFKVAKINLSIEVRRLQKTETEKNDKKKED